MRNESSISVNQGFRQGFRSSLKAGMSGVIVILIAFFPKCPICWMAYMSLFSSLGIGTIPYQPWIQPGLIGLLILNIGALYIRSRRREIYGPLWLSLAGTAVLIIFNLWLGWEWTVWPAFVLVMIGTLWNGFAKRPEKNEAQGLSTACSSCHG